MKQARVYKFLLIAVSVMMIFLSCISFSGLSNGVEAGSSDYFSGTFASSEFENSAVKFTVEKGNTVNFKNSLVANELAFDVSVPADANSLKINFKTEAFFAGGNYVEGEETSETVSHELIVNFNGSASTFNGKAGNTVNSGNLKVYFKVVNNSVLVALNSNSDSSFFGSTEAKYKVRNIDKCVANEISMSVELKESASELEFAINSVDQGWKSYTDGTYKQTFKTNADGEIETVALPRVALSDKAFVSTKDGYKLKAFVGTIYTVDYTAYSVLNKVNSADLTIKQEADVWTSNEDSAKQFVFGATGNKKLSIVYGDKLCEQYAFEVLDKANVSNTAPEYVIDDELINAYQKAVEKAATTETNGKKHSISIGKDVVLPSLENLVVDDFTSYAQMTYTVHYYTPDTSGTTTSLKVPTDKPGEYMFYVVFKDNNSKAMSSDDFFTVDDESGEFASFGKYEKLIFRFTLVDDAPIGITAVNQTKGYIGVKYTVSNFTITASSYTPKYELYYNADTSARPVGTGWEDKWVRIPTVSEISKGVEIPEGFTKEDIEEINYSGSLTFTPDREGRFVVKCIVQSNVSVRTESATAIVDIREKPEIVTPANPWIRENIASLIFLSVGTVCLIAVVALLFVKPKEDKDIEE